MRITSAQYDKSREALKKLAKHQDIVRHWDAAMKGYKAPEGQKVVEVQIKDGSTRYVTEKDQEVAQPLLKKSG